MIVTVSTTKFGVQLGEYQIDTSKLSEAQIAWAIQRGLDESATNSHASDTAEEHGSQEKAAEAAKVSFKEWVDKILAGHVPSSGTGRSRLDDFTRAMRQVTAKWLKDAGMKAGEADKAVKGDIDSLVLELAQRKVGKTGTGDAVEMANAKLNELKEAAEAIVKAAQGAPKADW